jgi:beta-N-acetylhexosaminidase
VAVHALAVLAAVLGHAFTPAAPPAAPAAPPVAQAGPLAAQAAPVARAARASCGISPTRLLGQRIMVGLDGTAPSASLLARVRRGEVGSVILFAANIVSRAQVRSLTGSLQRAARAGGNPPVLISVDQEGGQVKRLPAGPPHRSPPQMAATGNPRVARAEGLATGRYLRGLGINWDLAPVLDVPTSPQAFIWQQGRAFSFSAPAVARFGTAFAQGLQAGGTAATGKHFPGVGSAGVDTDNQLDFLRPTAAQRAAALQPYRQAIAAGIDSVMLSTAAFPAYDRSGNPSALSAPIAQGLLRGTLHFTGVTITDSPLGPPTTTSELAAGAVAARSGADVLLYTDSAPGVLHALESDLGAGRISCASARAAYARIVALKRHVAG